MLRFIRPWGRPAASAAAIALLILGAHSTAAAQAAKAAAIADTIRALEVARGQALMKADTAAIARMTADEFIEVSRLGQLRTKTDNLRDLSSGALKLATVKYDSTTVQVYGNVAILRAIADNTGSFRGFPFAGKIWITRVFVRRDGRWQAVAMQHTMIPS
jgi:ketosteroid isomerase-like protein